MNNNDIKHKQKLIMAIGNEERELLSKFWEKNQQLILSAMYANSINENLDPEERAKNIEAYESFTKGSGIGIKVQDYFGRLCKDQYLNNHIDNLIDLSYSKNNFNIGQSLLIRKTNDVNCGLDENGYPRYYKKNLFLINGVDYMLSSQWTSRNIENFLKWYDQFELEPNLNS